MDTNHQFLKVQSDCRHKAKASDQKLPVISETVLVLMLGT